MTTTHTTMEALPHQRGQRRWEAQVVVMDNEIWSLTGVANEKTTGQRSYNQKEVSGRMLKIKGTRTCTPSPYLSPSTSTASSVTVQPNHVPLRVLWKTKPR
jgi:hypothetical protein